MIKKRILIYLIILLLTLSNIRIDYGYASSPIKNLAYNESHTSELSTVKGAITFESIDPLDELARNKNSIPSMKKYDIKSSKDLIYGEPYKVMSFDPNNSDINYMKQFKEGKKMYDILKYTPYYWEFPILYKNKGVSVPVTTLDVSKGENILVSAGKWHVGTYPAYLNVDISYICSRPDKIVGLFSKYNINDADRFMHINIPDIGDFLYISRGAEEYFMPLQNNGDAKAFNLYNRSAFAKLYTPIMYSKIKAQKKAPNSSESNKQDSTKNLKTTEPIPRIYLILIGLVFVVYGVIKNWDKIKNKYPD